MFCLFSVGCLNILLPSLSFNCFFYSTKRRIYAFACGSVPCSAPLEFRLLRGNACFLASGLLCELKFCSVSWGVAGRTKELVVAIAVVV